MLKPPEHFGANGLMMLVRDIIGADPNTGYWLYRTRGHSKSGNGNKYALVKYAPGLGPIKGSAGEQESITRFRANESTEAIEIANKKLDK